MLTKNRIVRAILVAVALILVCVVSVTLIHRTEPGSLQSLAFALLPLPFFALSFYWLFRNARGCDEMQQRIQFEALAFAFPLSMILAITVQLIQKSGTPLKFSLGDMFIDMELLYFAGLYLAWRRYR